MTWGQGDPGRSRRRQVPAGIHAVLMPGNITRIVRWLVEDQGAVDQKLSTQETFDCVQERFMSNQPVGPIKEQVQAVQSPERAFPAVVDNRFDLRAKTAGFFRGKDFDREDYAFAFVRIQQLFS